MNAKSFFNLALAVTLTATVICGCSTARISSDNLKNIKELQPPNGKALVYFVRPEFYGFAVSFRVTCDNKPIGTLSGKRFIYTILDPGLHTFRGKTGDVVNNQSELSLNTQPNQTYFVHDMVQTGVLMAQNQLILLDEISGRKALKKCKLSGDCSTCLAYAK